jgi:hypothetical protein
MDTECDLSESTLLKECDFTWKIEQSPDQKAMVMLFDFKNKAQVSLGDENDYVIVKFWGAPYILTDDNKPIFKEPFVLRVRIPIQSEESVTAVATEAAAATVAAGGKTGLWIMFVLRLLFRGVMAEIIGMLGFMQLVIYLPLITVKFPATANILFKQLTSIVTFDLVPTDDYYPLMFDFPEGETLNDAFADMDFGSLFVMNMGSLFLVMTIIILQFPIYYLARCCNGTRLGKKI